MKIRSGFVSNSSSSSFIIGLANTGPDGEGTTFNPKSKDNPYGDTSMFDMSIIESLVNDKRTFTLTISNEDGTISTTAEPGDNILYLNESQEPEWDEENDEYEEIEFSQFESYVETTYDAIEKAGGETNMGITYG